MVALTFTRDGARSRQGASMIEAIDHNSLRCSDFRADQCGTTALIRMPHQFTRTTGKATQLRASMQDFGLRSLDLPYSIYHS
eukprot:1072643-Pleurochrysis_carterae.AAC.2